MIEVLVLIGVDIFLQRPDETLATGVAVWVGRPIHARDHLAPEA